MALTHLIKHVYNTASEEVVKRAKKIHFRHQVEMTEHDALMNSVVFRVKDDTYSTYYKVQIRQYHDPRSMTLRCSCPYNLGEICRHEAAALFQLQDLIDKNLLGGNPIDFDQRHTVVKMKHIDLKVIKMLTAHETYEEAEKIALRNGVAIGEAGNERVQASLDMDGITYPLLIQKNEERNFDTSCTCKEKEYSICVHKAALFLQLFHSRGAYYFDSIRNWDKEKNKLLQIYGYSLSDDIEGKFEFVYKDGKPFLKLLDPSIKRVAQTAPVPLSPAPAIAPPVRPLPEAAPVIDDALPMPTLRLGIVFNFNETAFPGFQVDAIQFDYEHEATKLPGRTEKIDLTKFVNTEVFSEDDKMLLQQLRKLQPAEVSKYLNRNSPFSGIWDSIVQNEGEELPDDTKALIIEYLHPKLQRLFEEQAGNPFVFYLRKNASFKTSALEELVLAAKPLTPHFRISAQTRGDFALHCRIKLNGSELSLSDNEAEVSLLFLYNHELHLWQKPEDVMQADRFSRKGSINLSRENWAVQMQKVVMPLTEEYPVEFDKSLVREVKAGAPEVKLQLQEKGEYLVFQPVFSYKGIDVKSSGKPTLTIPDGDKILLVHRDPEAEQQFINRLAGLHSQFIAPPEGNSLVLRGSDVLRNNWFFLFMDAMKEDKVPVFGFDALRNFRFNTARPSTHIHVSSGLDWFDARVEVDFSGQRVGIQDIKKALSARQSFVQLADGTLGILPEEWLKRYALLFKVGDGKTDKLRLSKYHMSVIDELYENREPSELSFSLDEKFERLRSFKQIPETTPPEDLKPVLRNYQTAGYQWLNYLNEVGWGGILADDMGLGKTVQALAMLQQYKQINGGLKAIVVCPTTLIYNWENEIKKFTPALTRMIHHGSMRTRDIEALQQANVVLTTYGTLRSDIQFLMKIPFDYIILDESQAIKNPASKVTRAASLLQARNRICMSGTPLQNNTFDLFAQMNFLNPGLLGSMDFFRNEFATPIDKFGEPEQKEHLRKLLYPFILRRTKEQVAKDLPEKTETILFCEMDKEQRIIYDAYRNSYRDKIMGVIDKEGIEKSQLTILQGLMKLRQICDSPAILNEDEKYPNHSIKLDELTREITENIGQHKALVFSQFLNMLALIREKLEQEGIAYEYFDGSTSVTDRQKAIDNFQQNENCRVFLISLKAGGVGLNLTAADYVYIVDPWWNPAVEQQAIDRTHRIGQTKNIFAYRMICIDTIEDKIMQLQEKKRKLASELISDDAHFVKALSKADVEYLFS